jgi:hypothetical protein
MKKIIRISVLLNGAILLSAPHGVAVGPYDSTDPRNCPARGQPGRDQCLRNMVQKGQAQVAYDTAYLESLNQSMRKACAAAEAADDAAKMLSWVPARPVKWGGRVWTSARLLTEAASGSRHDCERLRNELRSR